MRAVDAIAQSLADGVEQLKGYRLRAALASAGVCVGVATMVALNNLLGSAVVSATDGMRRLGGDSVFIVAKDQFSMRGRAPRALTLDDAEALRRRRDYFSLVSPLFAIRGLLRACGDRQIVQIYAVSPESYVLNNWQLASGRFVHDRDVTARAPVVVLSADLASQLSCGQVILSGQPFTVIGQLQSEGHFVGGDGRNVVMIPLSTAESKYGATIRESLAIFARIADGVSPDLALDGARRLLRARHGLTATNADDDFVFQSRDELLSASYEQARTATLAIVLVLAITLVIAGIGIVNSVLTAVTERTSEIGVRRAVGATRLRIAMQFVVESLLMSLLGGLAGAVVGYLLSREVAAVLGMRLWANWQATGLAILAAAILGLVAGVWPAVRAGELEPIEALRRE